MQSAKWLCAILSVAKNLKNQIISPKNDDIDISLCMNSQGEITVIEYW
jgi:hypothetical protein